MRIAFINTTDSNGGAAIVAGRLMKKLHQDYSTENYLFVKTKTSDSLNTGQILSNKLEIIAEKIIDRVTRPVGLLYQFFPFSSVRLLKALKSFKPDIINLHNTHGAYFATPLLKNLSQIAPIVWTLHDMWSFTANSSYTFDNPSWMQLKNDSILTKIPPAIGINTGAWLLRQKKRIYSRTDLTIVTPSMWMKNLALQSPVFEGKQIHHIFNGVDPDIFCPHDKASARQSLGLPIDYKTIMFSAHFLNKNNPWKGGMNLLTILSRINALTNEKINLLVLGAGKPEELNSFENLNLFYQGYVKDENIISQCLNASDLFIYPTKADNLPTVLIESIACGTPCITFDIGGSNEIIKDDLNGLVIKPFDFEAFALNTLALLKDQDRLTFFSTNCLDIAKKYFLIDRMGEQYYTLFQQLIKNKQMTYV